MAEPPHEEGDLATDAPSCCWAFKSHQWEAEMVMARPPWEEGDSAAASPSRPCGFKTHRQEEEAAEGMTSLHPPCSQCPFSGKILDTGLG